MGFKDVLTSALLTNQVRQALTAAGVPFSENAPLDGYQADFVFQTPDGNKHILEAKAWESTGAEIARAKKLAVHLRALPVAGSYVVFPSLDTEQQSEGVLSIKGLKALLKAEVPRQSPASGQAATEPLTPPYPKEQRIVFAAMPFASKYDDVFFVAIRGAAKLSGSVAKRVDKEDYSGDVVERIRDRISRASAVVVDLSESRPNVLYEMGFAQASGKPVLPICSTPIDEIPFDVRNLNILSYESGQTSALRPKLSRRLRAVFSARG